MAKEVRENRKPYDVLTGKTPDEIERVIKACVDMGKFELVGPVSFAGGQYTATVRNTQYQPPAKE